MPFQQFLDFARVNVFAAANEHVVGSAHEKIKTRRVSAHHVAGQVPAVPHPRRGGLRLVQIPMRQRQRAQRENALLGRRSVHQRALHVRERISQRQRRPRSAIGVRTEHRRPRLGGPIAVLDLSVREDGVHLREQRVGQRRRADRNVVHRTQIELLDELALAHHQREHGGNSRQYRAPVACHRIEIAARIEARQQDHGRALGQRHRDVEQPVHVVERRHDDGRLLRRAYRQRLEIMADRPQLAMVTERHTLG